VKTLWIILSGVAGVLAAVFVFRGDFEKAFVAAAAGAVCWILNYRQQLRDTLASQDEENQEDEDEEVPS
jgi:membrane protein implicated in regulation of membrane protease activity